MSIKDRFNSFIDYFTEDGEEPVLQEQAAPPQVQEEPAMAVGQTSAPVSRPSQPISAPSRPVATTSTAATQQKPQAVSSVTTSSNKENITRLHARQRELAQQHPAEKKVTIDVRYPRHYEEATDIVDLLLANESILIDFQYMTEVQARRCLDYLDGARYVLAGNLKKVASTMYLLTPINVVVNIEDIQLPEGVQVTDFDFDLKPR